MVLEIKSCTVWHHVDVSPGLNKTWLPSSDSGACSAPSAVWRRSPLPLAGGGGHPEPSLLGLTPTVRASQLTNNNDPLTAESTTHQTHSSPGGANVGMNVFVTLSVVHKGTLYSRASFHQDILKCECSSSSASRGPCVRLQSWGTHWGLHEEWLK